MEIVTGSTGLAHVTPIDDAVRNSNFGYYSEKIVFDTFRAFEAAVITQNEVRIYGGYGMNQGRLFKIEKGDYDSCTIENGAQGLKRADLIVARYQMDSQTGYESIELVVIKGQSGNTWTDPEYTVGNINEGATQDDFPLYRVKLDGLTLTQDSIEPLFTPTPDGGRLGIIEQRLDGRMLVDLEKTTRDYLDGSENVDLGIKGVLPVDNGGTGANDAAGAAKNIVIDTMAADSGEMTDATEFITSASSGGFAQALKKRTALNIWAYIQTKVKALLGMVNSEIVSVAHGGTGKSSIGNKKVLVGNSSGSFTEYDIGESINDPSQTKLATTQAVSDAMSSAGLGDMLSSVWTQDGYLKEGKGGIGNRGIDASSGGTQNSTAVATSGALYATKTALQTAFQAGVDTIYNAFVAKNVTPTASTPQALATAVGTTYDKGKTDAQAVVWTEDMTLDKFTSRSIAMADANMFYVPLKDVVSITILSANWNGGVAARNFSGLIYDSADTYLATALVGSEKIIPSNAAYIMFYDTSSHVGAQSPYVITAKIRFKRQCKILR